jgi:hypothetical protein
MGICWKSTWDYSCKKNHWLHLPTAPWNIASQRSFSFSRNIRSPATALAPFALSLWQMQIRFRIKVLCKFISIFLYSLHKLADCEFAVIVFWNLLCAEFCKILPETKCEQDLAVAHSNICSLQQQQLPLRQQILCPNSACTVTIWIKLSALSEAHLLLITRLLILLLALPVRIQC